MGAMERAAASRAVDAAAERVAGVIAVAHDAHPHRLLFSNRAVRVLNTTDRRLRGGLSPGTDERAQLDAMCRERARIVRRLRENARRRALVADLHDRRLAEIDRQEAQQRREQDADARARLERMRQAHADLAMASRERRLQDQADASAKLHRARAVVQRSRRGTAAATTTVQGDDDDDRVLERARDQWRSTQACRRRWRLFRKHQATTATSLRVAQETAAQARARADQAERGARCLEKRNAYGGAVRKAHPPSVSQALQDQVARRRETLLHPAYVREKRDVRNAHPVPVVARRKAPAPVVDQDEDDGHTAARHIDYLRAEPRRRHRWRPEADGVLGRAQGSFVGANHR